MLGRGQQLSTTQAKTPRDVCMNVYLLVGRIQLVRRLRAQEQLLAHFVVVEAALPPQDHPHRDRRKLGPELLDVWRGLDAVLEGDVGRRRYRVARLYRGRPGETVGGVGQVCQICTGLPIVRTYKYTNRI